MFKYKYCEKGRKHEAQGIENQDSCILITAPNGISIGIAADGMGQSLHAEEASCFAVDRMCKAVCSALPPCPDSIDEFAPIAIKAGFASALNGLVDLASRNKWPLDDLGTTLMCVIFDSRRWKTFFGSVGDGGIITLGADGVVSFATQPQKGEQFSQTYPVTDQSAWAFGAREDTIGFAIATDGIFDCLRKHDFNSGETTPNNAAAALLAMPFDYQEGAAAENLDIALSGNEGVFSLVTDDRTFLTVVAYEDCRLSSPLCHSEQEDYPNNFPEAYGLDSPPHPSESVYIAERPVNPVSTRKKQGPFAGISDWWRTRKEAKKHGAHQ